MESTLVVSIGARLLLVLTLCLPARAHADETAAQARDRLSHMLDEESPTWEGPWAAESVLKWLSPGSCKLPDDFEAKACREAVPGIKQLAEKAWSRATLDLPVEVTEAKYNFKTKALHLVLQPAPNGRGGAGQVMYFTAKPHAEKGLVHERLVGPFLSFDIPMAEAVAKDAPVRNVPGQAKGVVDRFSS